MDHHPRKEGRATCHQNAGEWKAPPVIRGSQPVFGFEDHCASAITKEHARAPVSPVKYAREGFRPNDKGCIDLPRLDEVISGCQCVDEA